jgi:hypothetical protein
MRAPSYCDVELDILRSVKELARLWVLLADFSVHARNVLLVKDSVIPIKHVDVPAIISFFQ